MTGRAHAGPLELRLERVTPGNSGELGAMAREFQDAGDSRFELALEDPQTFFEQVELFASGKNLPPDRVRQTFFWLFRGEHLVGCSRLRHHLIPKLERDGGHIAYEIRPTERRRGLGTALLRLTLEEARKIGLSRVLVTTEPTNLASIGVIRNNGGVFWTPSVSPFTGAAMNRYWIEL